MTFYLFIAILCSKMSGVYKPLRRKEQKEEIDSSVKFRLEQKNNVVVCLFVFSLFSLSLLDVI